MAEKRCSFRKLWRKNTLSGIDFLTAQNLNPSRSAPHVHCGYTISIVENGILPINFQGGHLNLKPHSFLILGPDIPHNFGFPIEFSECSYRTVFIQENFISKWLMQRLIKERAALAYFQNQRLWENYLNIQRRLENGSGQDINEILNVSEKLLAEMNKNVITRMTITSPYILTVQEYLKENFTSVPNIEELAEIVRISPVYLLRLFKEKTGLTPHAYINQLRVNRAREMMAKGISLLQITYDLGFADQSHFSKTFLKITGVNPTHYENIM